MKEVKESKETAPRAGVVRTYSDLLVYRQAYRLALDVSRLTKEFPREEQFEMARQIRIAIDECAETKFWIDLAADEGFVKANRAETLGSEYGKLGFMLHNLWKEWRKF
jgi:hypothetical protein